MNTKMIFVGKNASTFGVSQELDIDLSNYYTKAQVEHQKYRTTQKYWYEEFL